MAWNPQPEIAALRDMANRFNFDQVVALGFKYQAGQIEAMSYGRTRKLCDWGAELAKVCMDAVQNIDTPKPVAGVTWVDASTSVPDDELTVLLVLECGEVWTGFREAGEWRYVSADLITEKVTHWAEFPEPPQQAGASLTATKEMFPNDKIHP